MASVLGSELRHPIIIIMWGQGGHSKINKEKDINMVRGN